MQTYRCYSKIFRSHVEFLYKILMLPLLDSWDKLATEFSHKQYSPLHETGFAWSNGHYLFGVVCHTKPDTCHLPTQIVNVRRKCGLVVKKKSRIVLVFRCWTVKKTWGGISLTYSIKNNIVLSRFVKIIDIYFNKEHNNQSIIRHCNDTQTFS